MDSQKVHIETIEDRQVKLYHIAQEIEGEPGYYMTDCGRQMIGTELQWGGWMFDGNMRPSAEEARSVIAGRSAAMLTSGRRRDFCPRCGKPEAHMEIIYRTLDHDKARSEAARVKIEQDHQRRVEWAERQASATNEALAELQQRGFKVRGGLEVDHGHAFHKGGPARVKLGGKWFTLNLMT